MTRKKRTSEKKSCWTSSLKRAAPSGAQSGCTCQDIAARVSLQLLQLNRRARTCLLGGYLHDKRPGLAVLAVELVNLKLDEERALGGGGGEPTEQEAGD